MGKNITQDMACRQSMMKYAEEYGAARASRKYNKSRPYIYFPESTPGREQLELDVGRFC